MLRSAPGPPDLIQSLGCGYPSLHPPDLPHYQASPQIPFALYVYAVLERWRQPKTGEGSVEGCPLLQEAGSAQLQKQRKALQEENRKLQQQLLDAQAAVLQQQATVTDLQHLLAMAERRAVTPVKSQVPRALR